MPVRKGWWGSSTTPYVRVFFGELFIVVQGSSPRPQSLFLSASAKAPETVLIPSYVRSHQIPRVAALRVLLVGIHLGSIKSLKGIEQANQLLKGWGCFVPASPSWAGHQIIKFPRTRHVVNLGAATRDDLICQKENRSSISTLQYMSRRK